jgi:hypothetical protein
LQVVRHQVELLAGHPKRRVVVYVHGAIMAKGGGDSTIFYKAITNFVANLIQNCGHLTFCAASGKGFIAMGHDEVLKRSDRKPPRGGGEFEAVEESGAERCGNCRGGRFWSD